jgi:hypothetical protein
MASALAIAASTDRNADTATVSFAFIAARSASRSRCWISSGLTWGL